MGKKILFTYNEDKAIEIGNKVDPLLFLTVPSDKNLIKEMEDQGLDVSQFEPDIRSDLKRELKRFENELDEADFVFHRGKMLYAHFLPLIENVSGSKKNRIKKVTKRTQSFETLIKKKYLKKTHFLTGKELSYNNKSIQICVAKENGIPHPMTWLVDSFLSSTQKYPVILKKDGGSMGDQVYLIKSQEELKKYFINKDLVFHIFHSFPGGYTDHTFAEIPKKDDYIIQEMVDTPGSRDTHYRIFTMGDGSILCAVLCVSDRKKVNRDCEHIWKKRHGPVTDIWGSPNGELYLILDKASSNLSNGGTQIPLDKNENSAVINAEYFPILESHGLDPENPTLPEDLRDLASRNARIFSNRGFIYGGQDWISDKELNWYFLENNGSPGFDIFGKCFNNGTYKNAKKTGYKKIVDGMMNWRA